MGFGKNFITSRPLNKLSYYENERREQAPALRYEFFSPLRMQRRGGNFFLLISVIPSAEDGGCAGICVDLDN